MCKGEESNTALVRPGIKGLRQLGRPRTIPVHQAEKRLNTFLFVVAYHGNPPPAQGSIVETPGTQKSSPKPAGQQGPRSWAGVFKAQKKSGEYIEENRLRQQSQMWNAGVSPEKGESAAKHRQRLLYRTPQNLWVASIVLRKATSRIQATESEQTGKQAILVKAAHPSI